MLSSLVQNAEQVVENIDAANIELSQGEIDKIDSLFPIKNNLRDRLRT